MAIGRGTNWRYEGPISLRANIQAEFGGGTTSVAISRYRLGGTYVRDTGTYTWLPMAQNVNINGRIARFGQQSFGSYRGSTRYRETFATVNGTNSGINFVPPGAPEPINTSDDIFYAFPRGFVTLGTGTNATGTFPLLTVASVLDWPNYIRSNLRSSSVSVWTRGQYQGIKNGYYVTQTKRAALTAWITKTRSTAYYSGSTANQHGQRARFRGGDSWVNMWEIFAGAFSNDGTQVAGTLFPSGGDSSFRGSGGGGGKGGKGGTAAPGGFVLGGRTPASQVTYYDIINLYQAGYRYIQIMHSMRVRYVSGSLAGNNLNIPNAVIQVTT